MSTELHTLTATEAMRRIRAGKLHPEELMQACLARIAEREPTVRAFAWFDAGAALRAGAIRPARPFARAADRREGRAGYR